MTKFITTRQEKEKESIESIDQITLKNQTKIT